MEAQDETRLERQLKKGVLEMLVLRLVCQKPGHGYELLARMDRRSHGAFRLKEGTLYPILYRLEDDGLIVSSWQTCLLYTSRTATTLSTTCSTPTRASAVF